jgi:hypothetical protein
MLAENLMEGMGDASTCVRETGIMKNVWETSDQGYA